ncbi:UNKNOWN [Stylonychia lemnae]|uniref:Uncharacterized protein n=1 Tax=Stylonychia lemnae TaxID=5949 RepID=A0A078AHS8_STYLE|nr:UNKNOWN [Stylonychia lemnae]|eukprot:CDW81825.1 UNKNOWN [Stylonychia lemnae]
MRQQQAQPQSRKLSENQNSNSFKKIRPQTNLKKLKFEDEIFKLDPLQVLASGNQAGSSHQAKLKFFYGPYDNNPSSLGKIDQNTTVDNLVQQNSQSSNQSPQFKQQSTFIAARNHSLKKQKERINEEQLFQELQEYIKHQQEKKHMIFDNNEDLHKFRWSMIAKAILSPGHKQLKGLIDKLQKRRRFEEFLSQQLRKKKRKVISSSINCINIQSVNTGSRLNNSGLPINKDSSQILGESLNSRIKNSTIDSKTSNLLGQKVFKGNSLFPIKDSIFNVRMARISHQPKNNPDEPEPKQPKIESQNWRNDYSFNNSDKSASGSRSERNSLNSLEDLDDEDRSEDEHSRNEDGKLRLKLNKKKKKSMFNNGSRQLVKVRSRRNTSFKVSAGNKEKFTSPRNNKLKLLGLTPKISQTSKALDFSHSIKQDSLKPEISNTQINDQSITEDENDEEKREIEVITFKQPKARKLINKRVVINEEMVIKEEISTPKPSQQGQIKHQRPVSSNVQYSVTKDSIQNLDTQASRNFNYLPTIDYTQNSQRTTTDYEGPFKFLEKIQKLLSECEISPSRKSFDMNTTLVSQKFNLTQQNGFINTARQLSSLRTIEDYSRKLSRQGHITERSQSKMNKFRMKQSEIDSINAPLFMDGQSQKINRLLSLTINPNESKDKKYQYPNLLQKRHATYLDRKNRYEEHLTKSMAFV